ncbi:hypothetical protein WICANDRAFT_61066 [Wickerhamomyces anomalus NRRL Y-366-8]|uniref:Uncharacterized protein n=1 Tax=Wickerhamomyces anomalus (strain ATCC 58044 / CBS 1984 / NCYC 433 / NRRL Y-366-8) TaxID=683960 RepID=A0A1E3PCA0_WICAA|nr:uncharacterized protein WICANDRAFT_61066 [Wickerhamomyces anomalus NRRL Y-366-8]ODQ63025.1 hypothetical protein WICANDRAFT_61066 [Wickerhamomyces anomalus NRRL Y-366-8]
MSLLTDSSVAALATDPSVSATTLQRSQTGGKSSLPTAIFPSSASKITASSNSQVTGSGSPTTLSSSFYSNLQILTDTSSIAALASSGSISNGDHKTAASGSGSNNHNNNGALDGDSSGGKGSSSSSVASVSNNQKSDTSGGSSILFHQNNQNKLNWKLIAIPMMLALPMVL